MEGENIKEYALNVKSLKLHKKDCRFTENFEETKWKDFHTIDEALKSCKDITPCQKCFNGLKKFKKEIDYEKHIQIS